MTNDEMRRAWWRQSVGLDLPWVWTFPIRYIVGISPDDLAEEGDVIRDWRPTLRF